MTTRRKHQHGGRSSAARQPSAGAWVSCRTAVVLGLFAVVFTGLSTFTYTRTSATWDEPMHLAAGYAAAAERDFRLDPAHPPLLRIWAALPTLFLPEVSMDVSAIEHVRPIAWLEEAYLFAHRFLYVANDADRLLYRARLMIVLLGIGLGVLLFLWTRHWLGFAPAVAALACYTLEPNLLAHASLVTTDFGAAFFIFATFFFTWRIHAGGEWWNVAALIACVALAILSKFSALLLLPLVAVLLALAVAQRRAITARKAQLVFGLVAISSFAAVWAAYGFRYLPSASATWAFDIHEAPLARTVPALARVVQWIDANHLLPNAFTQGVFYAQASVTQMPAFLAGEVKEGGWWYYFPAAFVLKAPLAMLVALAIGVLACVRRRDELGVGNLLFVGLPIAAFLGVAMISGVNIGLRHILPIYPFLILIVAVGMRELLRLRRPLAIAALAVVSVAWVVEFGRAYPHTLTFFNALAGGPAHGYRYLSDSNLAWGQGLKELKAWMDRNGVSHVNLAYFGQADPAYYGIDCTYLPGSPTFAIDAIARPRLPGYVAISSTTLNGVYSPPSWRLFYTPFGELEPVAVVGNSIRIHWVEQWPDAAAKPADPDAHRSLADALLFGLQWPTQAEPHYRKYLRERPDDTDALINHGIALVAGDRIAEGVRELHRAVESDANHGRAQLMLGKALFGMRELAAAAGHAERAAALLSNDADARDLLRRVRAAQGQIARHGGGDGP